MSQTKKLNFSQLVWTLQDSNSRFCFKEFLHLRHSSFALVRESCRAESRLWQRLIFNVTQTSNVSPQISVNYISLTAHNWQKWKRAFLTCPCHEIYRDEAVGLKSCRYTFKITIFVNMWNLGQFRENLIFCQKLLNWSSNLKILLHMCDTYNCN